MKIDTNKIPLEGIILEEVIPTKQLELETETIKSQDAIKVRAEVCKITNVVNVDLTLEGMFSTQCSRCLRDLDVPLKKKVQFSYPVDKSTHVIDMNPDIRDEVIIGYDIKFLCRPDCKGLCPHCGKDLNQGGCSCATTKKKTF